MKPPKRSVELGALVLARRKQLRLTQEDVAALAGPSTATQRKIEKGDFTTLRLGTTWPLERVFGWRPGAINGFLTNTSAAAIEAAVEPNYDALRVDGAIPPGTDPVAVSPAEQHGRPLLNMLEEVEKEMTPEQVREFEARLEADAWKARREIMGG